LLTEILQSLKILSGNSRYGKIESEHDHTLNWIWSPKVAQGPGFLEWLQNEQPLFWINGKPGAGKSTLMKFIHGHKRTLEVITPKNSQRVILISFFFHELGTSSERTFTGLLHALMSQILTHMPELVTHIEKRFRNLKIRSGQLSSNESIWSDVELQEAFFDLLRAKSTEAVVLCLADGLDECEARSQRQALQFLLKLSSHERTDCLRFKILCSSRPENAIEISFAKSPQLKVQDYTSRDIKKFVSETFASVTSNLYPCEEALSISDGVVSKIVQKAEGVFIWVRLVVAELVVAIEARDFDVLNEKLEDLPSDLEKLYAKIVEKIPAALRHHTFNYLQLFKDISSSRYEHLGIGISPRDVFEMSLAIKPSSTALISSPIIMNDKEIISACLKTKGLVQERCRGLINLPSFDPAWNQDEMLKRLCNGKVSIHRTVLDYLFSENNIEKVWSGLDQSHLENPYAQLMAFHFRLLKALYPTQKGVNSEAVTVGMAYGPAPIRFIFLLGRVLSCISAYEEIHATPLGLTWLPGIETYLKTIFDQEMDLEKFYASIIRHRDVISCDAYGTSGGPYGAHPEDRDYLSGDFNLLLIATYFGIYSYVEINLRREESIDQAARPLLRFILVDSFSSNRAFDLARFLLGEGCRPDHEYRSETH
jgi:hypothetical protein